MERYGPEGGDVQPTPSNGSGWHFLGFAALTLVSVVALAGWGPAAVDDIRYARDQRQWAQQIEPARVQVTRMDPPAGARPCEYSQAELNMWGQICWHQSSDVQRAIADAQRILERVGGVVKEKECVKDPEGHLACLLYAELESSPLIINVFRPSLPGGGRSPEARVTGGLDGVGDYPRLFERILPGNTSRTSDGWWGGFEPGPLPQPEVISVD